MPKISQKQKILRFWKKSLITDWSMVQILGNNDENQKRKEDEIMEELILLMACEARYRYGRPFIHNSVPKSREFLQNVLGNLDDDRFRRIVRVSRPAFSFILNLIKCHKVFHGPRSSKQFPVKEQLAIVLYRLGSSGEGATYSKIASLFGIGDGGTIQNMSDRIFTAILELANTYLYWPDESERKELVSETLDELPHCIGYVDGTEIKLSEKPICDPEAYFSRKHMYSLKVQAVCDHNLKIRHMVLGYPGSVHDARIYNNSNLSTNADEMFSGLQWLAADSAYKLTSTVVTPFRANANTGSLESRNRFNRTHSKYRIRIEHCFGLLKERFGSLKELRIQIRDKSSIKSVCRWVLVCAILHNILICLKEEEFSITENDSSDTESETQDEFSTLATEGEAKRNALVQLICETSS